MPTWVYFAFGAALCWGVYGPALHAGRAGFTDPSPLIQSLRAILCVGGAYFLVALLVPAGFLQSKGVLNNFNMQGTVFSFLTGLLGAGGAICITWSFKHEGRPFYVMPLVFGFAPLITGIVDLITHPPEGGIRKINPLVYLGMLMVAGGAAMILSFKDKPLD